MEQIGSKEYALIARGHMSDTDGADRKYGICPHCKGTEE